jgi:hypothetical protein
MNLYANLSGSEVDPYLYTPYRSDRADKAEMTSRVSALTFNLSLSFLLLLRSYAFCFRKDSCRITWNAVKALKTSH